jgi:DNA repair protein RadC
VAYLCGNWKLSTDTPRFILALHICASLGVRDKELINLQEQVMAFFLNGRNKLIGYRLISTGTSNKSLVDVKLLVSLALHTMASAVILAYNHPCGNMSASKSDEVVTEKVRDSLSLIDIKLLDHFIICEEGYYSFSEQGEL